MSTLFHLAASVDALLAAITTAWAALGEIITAGALLLVLDRIASAIRATYTAGRFCGRFWYRYVVPAILTTADGVSWLLSQIDWAEVFATVAAGARVLIAAVVALALEAQPLLVRCSAALGKRYAALLVRTADAPAPSAVISGNSERCAAGSLPGPAVPHCAVRRGPTTRTDRARRQSQAGGVSV
jgi:hypothetical protein